MIYRHSPSSSMYLNFNLRGFPIRPGQLDDAFRAEAELTAHNKLPEEIKVCRIKNAIPDRNFMDFFLEKQPKPEGLPDIFKSDSRVILSKKARNVIESLDDWQHQYHLIQFSNDDGPFEFAQKYYWFHVR
ncbi:MAG: hypothetical protein H7X92_13510 [Chitinophagales bacterium]|nr:hypothetical protein [Hyphomicrobiales bacterium]